MAALIRKLVKVAPAATLTFIIVFVGGLSSVATDAGYLILIPLGAAAFLSVGRNPLAGLAAAYAGVSAGFARQRADRPARQHAHRGHQRVHRASSTPTSPSTSPPTSGSRIASTFFVALVITIIAERITDAEPRRATRPRATVDRGRGGGARGGEQGASGTPPSACSAALAVVVLCTVLPDAPLRNAETGAIFNDSPLMESLIFIITMLFLVAGICFGIGAKTITSSVDVINAIVKTFSGPGRPRLPAADHQPVHRLLQLQQHADGDRGEPGRLPGGGRHRRALAPHRLRLRDRAPRPDHARRRWPSGRSSPPSSCPCSSGSTCRPRRSSPPTGSVTHRPTSSRR